MLVWGALLATSSQATSYRPHGPVDAMSELNAFHVMHPRVISGKPEGSNHHTRLLESGGDGEPARHVPAFTLELLAFNETLHLELTQTVDLLGKNFRVTTYDDEGTNHFVPELCYYHGHVAGGAAGSSRVSGSTCDGFDGLIHANGEQWVVKPATVSEVLAKKDSFTPLTDTEQEEGSVLAPHIIFKISDLKQKPAFGCGADHDHSADHLEKKHSHDDHNDYDDHDDHDHGHGTEDNTKHEQPEHARRLQANNCETNTKYKNYVPKSGQCQNTWKSNGLKYCNRQCGNPDSDAEGPWCYTNKNRGEFVYCEEKTEECETNNQYKKYIPTSCKCKNQWTYDGLKYCNGQCGNPDNDANPWCFTTANCDLNYVYCEKESGGGAPNTGSPSPNSPGSFVELVVVNDMDQVNYAGGTVNAGDFAIKIINEVKSLYEDLDLDINIVLIGVINLASYTAMHDAGISISSRTDIQVVLEQLTDYRNTFLGIDNMHLITAIDRSGGTTGIAWLGTMCGYSSTGVSENTGVWQFLVETVAHEIGHNFGAEHDSDGNSCDGSQFLMAAVGCSDCPFNGFPKFSSCSKNYIKNNLQDLKNTPGNCLAGVSYRVDAVCGDGIVSDGEECDNGDNNGDLPRHCSASCKLNEGKQCSGGVCCDLNGRFQPSGTGCRASMHQCDRRDFCSGTSADCPEDLFKPDGTSCSEAGVGSRCFQGSCKGLDGQCATAFSNYQGTFTENVTSGSCSCRCMQGDECGKEGGLRCTNAPCQTYDCPAGNQCEVDGNLFDGPATIEYCSCYNAPSSTSALVPVDDGTPCENGGKMCQGGYCAPVFQGSTTCEEDCGANGKCGQTLNSTTFGCECSAGYEGSTCGTIITCDTIDCPSLNRQGCVAANNCGPCLDGFASSIFADDAANSKCDLGKTPLSVYNETASGIDVSNKMVDGDLYTHYIGSFPADGHVSVVFLLEKAMVVSRYDMVSSNSHPAQDPANFTIMGSNDFKKWTLLHELTDFKFVERHQTRSFLVKDNMPYAAIKLTVTDVADPESHGSAQLNLTQDIRTNGTDVTVNTMAVLVPVTGNKTFKVQLAEFMLFHSVTDAPVVTDAATSAAVVRKAQVAALLALSGVFALLL